MRITAKSKLETCINGDFVFMYTFDKQWTREAMQALAPLGQLKVYDSFPKPMFQLSCPGCIAKGVQDTDECRVIYYNNVVDSEEFEGSLEKVIGVF